MREVCVKKDEIKDIFWGYIANKKKNWNGFTINKRNKYKIIKTKKKTKFVNIVLILIFYVK